MSDDYESIFVRLPHLFTQHCGSTDYWLSHRHDTAHFSNFLSLGPLPAYCLAKSRFLCHHHTTIRTEQKVEDALADCQANEQRIHKVAEGRWERPDLYPRTQFEDNEREVRERWAKQREARRAGLQLQHVSEQLSSIRRPPQPLPAPPSQSDSEHVGLLDCLRPELLYAVLSFLPNADFFLRFPFLSHRCRYLYTDPALHRQPSQQRFGLNAQQWRLYCEHSWPRLHVPVGQVAYHLTAETNSSVKQEWDVSCSGENDVAEQQHSAGGDKDWALEATHLYQHILFATHVLTQGAPNVTSDGRPIHWQLPRALVALLVDRLTARRVIELVNHICKGRQQDERLRFLPLPYFHFSYRTHSNQPLYCHLPSASKRPFTSMEQGAEAAETFQGSGAELLASLCHHSHLFAIPTWTPHTTSPSSSHSPAASPKTTTPTAASTRSGTDQPCATHSQRRQRQQRAVAAGERWS